MHSFTVTAIGALAKNPELTVKADTMCTRFCLVGNDRTGKNEEGNAREMVASFWFVAFGALSQRFVLRDEDLDRRFTVRHDIIEKCPWPARRRGSRARCRQPRPSPSYRFSPPVQRAA